MTGVSTALAQCSECDLQQNLWLCLTCGSLGCGRKNYDGSGGNGHGLKHYEETKHAVCVKLGTITPEGDADIFCYLCDDMRLDKQLGKHLSHFGINIATQQKTDKSMAELVGRTKSYSSRSMVLRRYCRNWIKICITNGVK